MKKKSKSEKPKKQAEEKNQKSKIGRQGAGALGQNWAESPDVASKGRYAQENRIQGDEPDYTIDTDVSGAV
jgi:hypothetical protein